MHKSKSNQTGKAVVSLAGLILVMASATSPVAASEEGRFKNSFIILGPAFTPEYMGSEDYETVPMLVSAFDVKGIEFEIEGLTADAAFLNWSGLKIGMSGDIDMGRDDEVDNANVALMKQIDTAFNLGAFISYNTEDTWLQGDNIEIKLSGYSDTTDVHNGAFATLGLTYTFPLAIPWRFELELETTYANSSYMDAYFGVDCADASASGLPEYKPSASFRDITITSNIAFFFSPRWGLFSRLSAGRLLGDAADSPIAATGSDNQFFAGLGILYRF